MLGFVASVYSDYSYSPPTTIMHARRRVLVYLPALTALAHHISHSHSGIDEKRPTKKFVHGS